MGRPALIPLLLSDVIKILQIIALDFHIIQNSSVFMYSVPDTNLQSLYSGKVTEIERGR